MGKKSKEGQVKGTISEKRVPLSMGEIPEEKQVKGTIEGGVVPVLYPEEKEHWMVNGEVVSGKLEVNAGVDQIFDLSGSERIHLDEFDKTILTDEIVQALGIDRKDVVLYREYPDRVNVLLRDGRKVVYRR